MQDEPVICEYGHWFGLSPRRKASTGQQVHAAATQFSGTGTGHDELMRLIFFDQGVDAVQHDRRFLYFINNISFNMRVGFNDPFDPIGVGNMVSECRVVQQINKIGIRACLFEPGGLAGASGAKVLHISG